MSRAGLERFGLGRVPTADVTGDVVFPDRLRQLEDESAAVHAWQDERNATARRQLAALPGFQALRAELATHVAADRLAVPRPGGDRWFWPVPDRAGDVRALAVSGALGAPRLSLVEANGVAVDGDEAIDWFVPAPDGRLVAIGVSSRGDEDVTLALVDADSGALVGPPVRHVRSVAWLPGGDGLHLARGAGPSSELPLLRPAFLTPGGRPRWIDGPVADARLELQVSADGRQLALAATGAQLLAVHDLRTGAWVEPGLDPETIFCGAFAGEGFCAVTDLGAPRRRLVAATLDALGAPSRWRELVPEGDAVLRAVAPCGDGLVLYELLDGEPRLRLLDLDGASQGIVELPDGLAVRPLGRGGGEQSGSLPAVVAPGGELLFGAAAPGRSSTLWRRRPHAAPERLTEAVSQIDGLRRERLAVRAPDGWTIPVDLIWQAEEDGEQAGAAESPGVADGDSRPLLVHGYGGFDVARLTSGYLGQFAPWVRAGGRFAFVHLRGDGTFGSDQWHGGRRARKQRSIDDMVAALEQLAARGLATPAQTALTGASNGGLMAAAVLAQRPELLRAAALLVPMADMARLQREHVPELFVAEYGDPREIEQARWLRGYSPYHAIARGRPYPAAIVVAGAADVRTHPFHARKLAAALLDAAEPPAPVLLRVHERCGHETAVTHPDRIAEWLAFLMAQVGLAPAPQSSRSQPIAA